MSPEEIVLLWQNIIAVCLERVVWANGGAKAQVAIEGKQGSQRETQVPGEVQLGREWTSRGQG